MNVLLACYDKSLDLKVTMCSDKMLRDSVDIPLLLPVWVWVMSLRTYIKDTTTQK